MSDPQDHRNSSGAATKITPEKWQAARAAVKVTSDRFVEMVLAAPDPTVLVTADWSVADTAAHVTSIAWLYTSLARLDETRPLPMPGLEEPILATTVDTVSKINEIVLDRFTDRDVKDVCERLRGYIDDMLRVSDGLDPSATVSWLGGARVPLAGIVAHLVNELLIHGRDVARGIGVPWPIPQEYAALFFELFLVEVFRHDMGRLMDTGQPPSERRIAVQFRSSHTAPVTLVLHRGRVTAEEPRRDDDIRLFFEPAVLNLMLFHRISPPRAALTGKVRVWGRRPWLLPAFMRTVHLP